MAARRSRSGYDGQIAGLYDLEDTIGRGHFAVVKLARHVFTGERVAVKVIDKTKLDEVSRSHLFQEVRCMKLVQHPNVVRLYEVIDTQTKLYLILELGDGGDLYEYIMRHTGGLDEKLAKRYFRQIVEAISYCHKLHVVHRDLKPENVVFFEKLGLVKLTDFGFSNMFAPGKKLETSCGSLAYSAPEILLGDSYDAPAVDVWSLGVILYMLVVGEAPFQEANDSETLTMIMDCRYHVPANISEKCRELIAKMLQREPSRRASLSDIMGHTWLNDGDLTPMSTFLPLITKEMISDDDHTYVVQKMVEGNIASRDEVLSSIEKDSYDHITATYYLLVERRLRKHHQHEHLLMLQQQQPSSGTLRKQSAPSPSKTAKPHLEPLMLSPRVQESSVDSSDTSSSHTVQSLVSPPGTRPSTSSLLKKSPSSTTDPAHFTVPVAPSRKYSLIKEESYDEYDEEEDEEYDMDTSLIKPVKSLESLDDMGPITHVPVPHTSPTTSSAPEPVNPRRPLKSVCSSPQLLNQIHEENESEDDDDLVPLKTLPRRYVASPSSHSRENSSASPEILRKYEQRKKRRGAGQRGTSCSSSDASDTDDTEGRSRKDKLRHKFIHRRDSSDHSSDTDGPGGSLGGNGRLRGGGGSGTTSRGSHSQNTSGGGGGSGGGGSRDKNDKKENSDSNQSNNKHSSNNQKNSRYHCGGGVGGSKGSLTDSSLKLLSRKLSDISTGVGALLNDCRGSDCDIDSSPHKTPSPCSPDHNGSVGSGSFPRHSRTTSLRSLSSTPSRLRSDSALFVLNEADSPSVSIVHPSPMQYVGRSADVCCGLCQCYTVEFSDMCRCVSGAGSLPPLAKRSSHVNRKLRGSPCAGSELSCGALHCKPSSGRGPAVRMESKCCSVV